MEGNREERVERGDGAKVRRGEREMGKGEKWKEGVGGKCREVKVSARVEDLLSPPKMMMTSLKT